MSRAADLIFRGFVNTLSFCPRGRVSTAQKFARPIPLLLNAFLRNNALQATVITRQVQDRSLRESRFMGDVLQIRNQIPQGPTRQTRNGNSECDILFRYQVSSSPTIFVCQGTSLCNLTELTSNAGGFRVFSICCGSNRRTGANEISEICIGLHCKRSRAHAPHRQYGLFCSRVDLEKDGNDDAPACSSFDRGRFGHRR